MDHVQDSRRRRDIRRTEVDCEVQYRSKAIACSGSERSVEWSIETDIGSGNRQWGERMYLLIWTCERCRIRCKCLDNTRPCGVVKPGRSDLVISAVECDGVWWVPLIA